MILMARDKTKPLEKLRWSKAGLKLLDAAVRASPKDDMIRVLRGKACNKLPEKHFRRTATAIEDFAYLVDRKERNEVSFTDKEYSQLVYDLGDAYSRIGRNRDAIATLRKLDGMSIDPELRRLVTERLQSLAGKPEVEVVPQESGASSILLGIAAQATARALQTWAENQRKKEEEARRREEQRRKKRKKRRRR
ncbi:hypothetical protein FE782_18280 [Paenibacillus antri]|uniref:Tetratricopeptide repeat protein n=2 Tax=Paenibacillus antri TaxID=2582848 RepID=A0A5R9GBP7_9BACL|nr:hypothetical protein FE782_18280 [Paenibacillus antri]